MVTPRTLAPVAVVAVLVAILVVWLKPDSPERQVRNRFRQLEELVTRSDAESPLLSVAHARQIGALFDESCEIRTDVSFLTGTMTREEISQKAIFGQSQFSDLTLRFHDLKIDFPGERRALVLLSATLKGRLKGGDHASDAQELECELARVDGEWRFRSIRIVQVLKP